MFKVPMTYVDFNGNTRTEDFYFNLTKAELMRMELSVHGGLVEMGNRAIAAQDTPALLAIFEDLIQKSYGIKDPDGRGFRKRPEDLEAFMATEAYSDLYMKMITDAEFASEFFNKVIPEDLAKQAAAQLAATTK